MRLNISLLLKNHRVYRNNGWKNYIYLGDLKNILRLYRDCCASEITFFDIDGSLNSIEFSEYFVSAIKEAISQLQLPYKLRH